MVPFAHDEASLNATAFLYNVVFKSSILIFIQRAFEALSSHTADQISAPVRMRKYDAQDLAEPCLLHLGSDSSPPAQDDKRLMTLSSLPTCTTVIFAYSDINLY